MQQLMEKRYRRADQKLQVRIGISAGEATVKDGNYFGMPSIEAARLCAQAESAGSLVSTAVRILATRLDGRRLRVRRRVRAEGVAPRPVEALAGP